MKRCLTIAAVLLSAILPMASQVIDPEWERLRVDYPRDTVVIIDNDNYWRTLLDTTVVIEYSQRPGVKNPKTGRWSKKGQSYFCYLSNDLWFTYGADDALLSVDVPRLGAGHVINIQIGNIVVVRILERNAERKVVEFVDNLSRR